jgi:hypothetical protein
MELSEPKAKQILGISGSHTEKGDIRADEWQRELKGRKAIQAYREMRDSDATIGAVMYATEQVLRDIKYKVKPTDDTDQAKEMATFVEQVLLDMDHSLDDHISEAVSCLSYGFADFEVVYKRRIGPTEKSPKKRSKYTDGYIGVRKLASRAQWTVRKFDVDEQSGEMLGLWQDRSKGFNTGIYIPADKLLHYKTTTTNNDPSGRSILRNAYKSYTYLTNLQAVEAIAIEREWHGMPVGRIPAQYLDPEATEAEKSFKQAVEQILRDVKRNEEGFILIPSDPYLDDEGKPTNIRQVDIELISAQGNRSIAIDPIIKRYQHDIARSVMAEFMMLGSGNGSYALSKSKTDLFLRALESYLNTIFDVINKQLITRLWELNGFDFNLMPTIIPGDVAPHDLRELGSYLRNLNGAGIPLKEQVEIVDEMLSIAELPNLDRDVYTASLERERLTEEARRDYYDGPDDNVVGRNQGSPDEE